MKRSAALASGHHSGAQLAQCGRATRHEVAEAEGGAADREIWRLPAADEAVGDRLLALGAEGLGGFVDGGIDEEGVWLLRLAGGATLAERMRARKGPWPWEEAVRTALAIARALAASEKASLFAGPVTPDTVEVTRTGVVFLPAAALVSAMVGATDAGGARGSGVISPLWTPPEQANGAMWDSAANRYAVGLVLYRLLSGEHPFGGAGLRHALGEAAHREAAPFVDAVATALPSGLQSLALRLLDPDRTRRPARAEAIAADLGRFLGAPVGEASPSREPREPRLKPERDRTSQSPSTRTARAEAPFGLARRSGPDAPRVNKADSTNSIVNRVKRSWPIAAALAVAAGAISLLAPAPPSPKLASVAPEAPLAPADTAAQDCAQCHTRQAAEWRRSVMAHSVKSPLFNALESLIQEQVGRDFDCPHGAGILRRANGAQACRDRATGIAITGSGGEHWCVNCHSAADNLGSTMPAWDGRAAGDPSSRRPVRDILGARALEGISCGFCHQVHGPVGPRGSRGYQGNPTWTSTTTGATFAMRPEDARGLFGIGNSGYDLRPEELLLPAGSTRGSAARPGLASPDPATGGFDPVVHARPSSNARAYLQTSEFCGTCHDVRLFGTDTLGGPRGEHFKRLRNAYSEWASWAKTEERAGRAPATCQDCHMSSYPGVCEPGAPPGGAADPECPPDMHFVKRSPGSKPRARPADNSPEPRDVSTHYFSGVDVPLSREFAEELIDEPTVDLAGIPLSARRRRDILLRHTFRFDVRGARRGGAGLEIPIEIENVGAGHRVPAGFSQEREFWVHLTVRDGTGRLLYEVGHVDRGDEDLHDKVFVRVSTRPDLLDAQGRPEGLFGADVRDGPDLPRWSPPPILGGTSFRGLGLINFQNGFLRCVRCIGTIGPSGECEPGPGQGFHRADHFADGDYDQDTGECRSNLTGMNALFETFFPVGALDASRGLPKGPDAIIDTRSVPPGVPLRYTYDLPLQGRRGPFRVEARLLFRAFPPFLVRAFAEYEREQARRGLRPSGPLVTLDMLKRLEVVELSRVEAEVR